MSKIAKTIELLATVAAFLLVTLILVEGSRGHAPSMYVAAMGWLVVGINAAARVVNGAR